MVVEIVTGLPLAQQMGARIFGPLGLSGSAYPSDATLPTPFPTPHAVNVNTGATSEQPQISPTALAGSGAMRSTLADLLSWGDELGSGRRDLNFAQEVFEALAAVVAAA